MNHRTGIRNLEAKNSYISVLVNGIQTLIVKNGNNLSFLLPVDNESIHGLLTREEINNLSNNSGVAGRIEICKFLPGKVNNPGNKWYFVNNNPVIKHHIELAVSQFFQLIDSFQNWPSFTDYLNYENQADASPSTPEKQIPFEYWWLTGKQELNTPVHDVLLYQDLGVFIRPEDNRIPLFTSSLYADMAGYHYSLKYKVKLTPSIIYCPTCFLTGISALLGNRSLSGGLLNEQWDIRFFTCHELMNTVPCSFFIDDTNGSSFELIGCTDTEIEPVWLRNGNAPVDSLSFKNVRRTPWEMNQRN